MPATYAHYRFGAAMLKAMPGDIGRTVKRYRRLFDVGLHGPDIFFYYKPLFSTKIERLGHKFHMQTGREFFGRVCRNLRLEPTEAGSAYLYGVLCHYTLDSLCHPVVEAKCGEGVGSHTQLEAAFDCLLMEQDGKAAPYREKLTDHMYLTPEELPVAARFYPGVQPKHIRDSLKGMVMIRKLLELPDGCARDVLTGTMGRASRTFADMIPEPNPENCRAASFLLKPYAQAEECFPELLLQLNAHLTYNAPLGGNFAAIFG